jgi:hypothetical protein
MKTLIFLDDERDFEDVTWVKYPEFDEVVVVRNDVDFLLTICTTADKEACYISFDHDIACYGKRIEKVFGVQQIVDGEITGLYCCEVAIREGFNPHQMFVHSCNPVGVANIQRAIDAAKEEWK